MKFIFLDADVIVLSSRRFFSFSSVNFKLNRERGVRAFERIQKEAFYFKSKDLDDQSQRIADHEVD